MPPPGASFFSPAVRTGASQSAVSHLAFEPKIASQKSSGGVMALAITPPSLLVKKLAPRGWNILKI
ncbi:hypothetical protein JP39_08495 [Companilactobacillus heilongjiangensis]|uniref:Uncharacterized protein n=1 Tax=Companilactobacillus heilongjiangensis TaxID=1074467 RepID=A0A0K2LDL0_9LACO|nr:hypothetical protein JP39_08495 [Companilactobacillus heilongjiangensis]